MKTFVLLALLPFSVFSQTLTLDEFKFSVPDIASRGLKKEDLFKKMNRSLIKENASECSNRALMWGHDFKRHKNLDTAKIFLFYTAKSGHHGNMQWWFHVSPMVNENGKFWVMDAGFPSRVKSPLAVKDWLKEFTGKNSVCKEIKPGEEDLVERMFSGHSFPENTRYGKYDCYYKFAPAPYWTPEALAKHLLGRDAEGRPVNYVRDEFEESEVYTACVEAATSSLGRALGMARGKCRNYMQNGLL